MASFFTTIRIVGAFVLLLLKPLSASFFAVYFLCCISDILDGYIARKTETTSKFGEIFDSIADFILIVIVFIIFIPLIEWDQWMVYWICIIALMRFLSLGIGFLKYRAFSLLHTYTNKVTGIALICFPILFQIFGKTITTFILCGLASLSALEELIINTRSKVLNRNIESIFVEEDIFD